ncbi:translocation protein [Lentinula aff. detonsa]|uniref:Translocation protein SEC62 n=1 Tax=Lentinula aff. detonsa TaxID=2804958 RepID=A0AA38KV19_9AGAR|nr:translocation protein [Lentinula aff. detonsa]
MSMEQQAKAPLDMKKVAQFLQSGSAGVKVRVGALNGKRIDYFKGKSAVKALLSPAYAKQKNMPKITTETEALTVLNTVNAFTFFLRVQRGGPSGSSSSSPEKIAPDEYYAWFYDGSPQWTTYAGGILMVAIMLAGVMFPLWPPSMLCMLGLIGLFFAIAIVRLIFYIIMVIVASPGVWIFPQLFADVGNVDLFIPLWEWDVPKKKSTKKKGDTEHKDKTSDADELKKNGGAFVEEVDDSGNSRPQSRSAKLEEVEDEEDWRCIAIFAQSGQ